MKKLSLILLSISFVFIVNAQNRWKQTDNYEMKLNSENHIIKQINSVNKVPGTIHYSEDFDTTGSGSRAGINNNIPIGWTVVNNAANANNWIWSDAAPGGQYSTTIPALNSTTAANGFMSLRADLYNTPFPPGGPVAMDTYFVSDAIALDTTVNDWIIEFEHFQRYCCLGSNELVVQVSNDSMNWKTIDATGPTNAKRGPNTITPNGERLQFIVSDTLGGQSQAWIRFRSTFNTHYFWMIDDLKLIEGRPNSLFIADAEPVFSRNHLLNPIYSQVPQFLMQPMEFDFEFFNGGSGSQNALTAYVDLYHDSTFNGQVGSGWRYSASQLSNNNPFPSLTSDFLTVDNPPYNNLLLGDFRIDFDGSTSAIPQAAIDNKEYRFSVGDTVFAVDNGAFVGSGGPSSYTAGGQDGDRWGVIYENMRNNAMATSVSIYVNDSSSIGSAISPRIWNFRANAPNMNINAAISTNPFATSPFSHTVTASDINSWINLPLFPPTLLIADSQYVVGWEQTSGALTSSNFVAARNLEMEAEINVVSNVAFFNDATPRWITPPILLAVRLNYGGLTVGGIETQNIEHQLSVSPNPSNGQIKIEGFANEDLNSKLIIRDSNGKMVYEEWIKGLSGNYNLEYLEKGVYFLTVVGESKAKVKRIVIY